MSIAQKPGSEGIPVNCVHSLKSTALKPYRKLFELLNVGSIIN